VDRQRDSRPPVDDHPELTPERTDSIMATTQRGRARVHRALRKSLTRQEISLTGHPRQSNAARLVVEQKRTDSIVTRSCLTEAAGLHSKHHDGHRGTV
jgi:hypothetical protein